MNVSEYYLGLKLGTLTSKHDYMKKRNSCGDEKVFLDIDQAEHDDDFLLTNESVRCVLICLL